MRIAAGDGRRHDRCRQSAVRRRSPHYLPGELLRSLARKAGGSVGQRAAHLAALRAALENGTMKPDPQRIAQRLLTSAELDAQLRALLIDCPPRGA